MQRKARTDIEYTYTVAMPSVSVGKTKNETGKIGKGKR